MSFLTRVELTTWYIISSIKLFNEPASLDQTVAMYGVTGFNLETSVCRSTLWSGRLTPIGKQINNQLCL